MAGLFSFGLGLGVGACSDPGSGDDCTAGTLYCPCVAGQCQGTLQCIANLCVVPGGGETGDGDPGDGDPGDGDPGDGDPGDGDGDNPCDPGQSLCDGMCVDTQADPSHCGSCEPCGNGEVCDAGRCTTIDDCTMTPCPGLSYCDLQSMKCLPGCINDDQCVGGQICNLDSHDCECGANVSECFSDSDCPTDACYLIPFLGGQCGECSSDADCQFGCNPYNPNGDDTIGPNCLPLSGSKCNDGGLGAGCESSGACQPGLTCEIAWQLFANVAEIRGCSECSTDGDCGNQLCTPIVNQQIFTGHRECLPPGSLAQNKPCELSASGDQTCATGVCSIVTVMGITEVGACGECHSDADCGGAACIPGSYNPDIGALTGSTCN